jgi:hypothetical protein
MEHPFVSEQSWQICLQLPVEKSGEVLQRKSSPSGALLYGFVADSNHKNLRPRFIPSAHHK